MKKIFSILRLSAASLMATAAPMAMAQIGNSSYEFLNIPVSSHAMALGGAGLAIIDDDISLVDQNPALLGAEIGKQLGLGYMHYLGDANFASARFGMAAGERGAWSGGVRYLHYGELQGYDQSGVETGTFTASDIVVGGSYSHDFSDYWRGGISINGIISNYESYSAFALSADIGLNYYNSEKDLSFSIVLRNMGGQLKRFEEAYNRLPFDIQLGYMQRLGTSPFSLAIAAKHLTRWNLPYYGHDANKPENDGVMHSSFFSNLFRHLNFGIQYSPTQNFYAAIGYDYKMRTDMSAYHRSFLSGFSLGAGLRVSAFNIGVAYAQPHKGGAELMLNLATTLGEF